MQTTRTSPRAARAPRSLQSHWAPLVCLALAAFAFACDDDDDRRPPPTGQDFQIFDMVDTGGGDTDPGDVTSADGTDGDATGDGVDPDAADGDAVDGDVVVAGPTVTIESPLTPPDLTSPSILTSPQLEVACRVEGVEGGSPIDTENVQISVSDGDGTLYEETARAGQMQDVYVADFDLAASSNGQITIGCEASELGGEMRTGSDQIITYLDQGPTITVDNPVMNGSYSRQLSVIFRVEPAPVDPMDTLAGIDPATVEAYVGTTRLTDLAQDAQGNWVTTFDFEDPMLFDPPLTGDALLRIEASNARAGGPVERVEEVRFNADNSGALIEFVTPTPGTLVGGLFEVELRITDPAGIDADSVQVTVAGTVSKSLAAQGNDIWSGTIDARSLSRLITNPQIEASADDLAGNTATNGIAVTLDLRKPLIDLDPPLIRERNNDFECSVAFDPIGEDTPGDMAVVPQLTEIRARIEDQGNGALSTGTVIAYAGINNSTVRLFLLDNTAGALLVDTNNDGACDEINPNLQRGATVTGPDGVAVLDLGGVDPTGGSYFWSGAGIIIAADESKGRCQGGGCAPNQFTCSNGTCLATNQLCDGADDCGDGSDEDPVRCMQGGRCDPATQYACPFGGCIPLAQVCDGNDDCLEGEDEASFRCGFVSDGSYDPLTEFLCEDGDTIPLDQACNSVSNCLLGADEASSLCSQCPVTSERCPSGTCVNPDQVCDAVPHCAGDLPYESEVSFITDQICVLGNTTSSPPDPICAESSPLRRVIKDVLADVPVIYGVPPINDNNCAGSAVDFLGANISEGWVCAAVRAEDNLGNIGISRPLRLCYDADGDGSACTDPVPDCTGSYDSNTSVDDPTMDCTVPDGFREHPWRNLREN